LTSESTRTSNCVGALTGLRVLEFGQGVAASYCGKLLADYGADVVKIEPLAGDPTRHLPPFAADHVGPESSGAFIFLNANKRAMTLDLTTPSGRAIARDLAREVDILVESFPPGTLESWGMGYDDLYQQNPGVVLTRITPFGQSGPYRDWVGTEIVVDAMGGWMYGLGEPDREPLKPPGLQAQIIGGTFGLLGTLSAISARDLIGVGQQVDVSLMEAVLWILMNITTIYEYSKHVWRRAGGRSTMNYPQGLLPCKDGLIGVNVLYYVEWDRFCEFVGHPEWQNDHRFATPLDRAKNHAAMDEVLIPWLAQYTADELYHRAQQHKIPFGKVNNSADLFASPQLAAREYWVEQEHPVAGQVVQPGAPFKLSETPWAMRRPAPLLGQHTDQILHTELGYAAEEIARLREVGVI
jgi:CoA:oxalate CoA-transferase